MAKILDEQDAYLFDELGDFILDELDDGSGSFTPGVSNITVLKQKDDITIKKAAGTNLTLID